MKSQDMVEAGPKSCTVLFENDQVRLVQVRLKPGEKLEMHFHSALFDIWMPRVGAKIRETTSSSSTSSTKIHDLLPGQGLHGSGPYEHSIENIGETEYQSLAIELKQVTELKPR